MPTMKPKTDYEEDTVAQLIARLRVLGLHVGGSKAVLGERLDGQ